MDVRGLADATLLDVWERTVTLERPWRELALLAAACDEPPERLARLSIGERDRLLLAVRERTFGSRIDCETSCGWCQARLELSIDTAELSVARRPVDDADLELADSGFTVRFRLPDSSDVAACRDVPGNAAEHLLGRCVEVVDPPDASASVSTLPSRVRDAVAARIAALDPQAEMLLDLECPECARRSQATFDPAAYLLAEVEARAARLLREVDVLARAYGWREADVLALGPARRRRYLELATQ